MPRESWFGKLNRHFHTHPQGRLHEILFWAVIGVVIGAFALVAWMRGWLSTPLALMLAVVALCFLSWAFLPQKKVAPKPLPKGKRGQIAKQVAASKDERKKKGPGPPPPPIRRG